MGGRRVMTLARNRISISMAKVSGRPTWPTSCKWRVRTDSPGHALHRDRRAALLALVTAEAVANLAEQHLLAQHGLDRPREELSGVAAGAHGRDGVVARIGGQQLIVCRRIGLAGVQHGESVSPDRASSASRTASTCIGSSTERNWALCGNGSQLVRLISSVPQPPIGIVVQRIRKAVALSSHCDNGGSLIVARPKRSTRKKCK